MGSSYEHRWQQVGYAFAASAVMNVAAILATRLVNHQKR